jgi:protein-disulfide isomerase
MDAKDGKRAGLRLVIPVAGALALGLWLPACSASAADSSAKDNPNQVVARINGKAITEAELKANSKDTFDQLEREYRQKQHEIMESQLHQLVQDRVLDLEAAASKKTKDQLLAEIKPAEVTDADVDKFYEENKAQIPRPKDQIAPQIKQYLAQQRQSEAREKFYGTLEAKYKAEYLMEPIRVEVAAAGPAKGGPAGAPVTIVEFSDFQCPYCSRLNPTIDQVMSKYGSKVRLVFRQFPLPMHQNAAKAAEAALCANEQGKFWEMHDSMFKDQAALAVDALKTKAAGLGLNAQAFNSCLDSGKEAAAVKADMKAGQEAGVNGTPAMFVNGRFISGVVPASQLSQVIDEELKKKG